MARFVGLEFADKGRGPRYDCWGFVRHVYEQEAGLRLPSYDVDYQRSNDHLGVAELIEREIGAWRRVPEPRALDLVILTVGGIPCHCGVALDEREMLHLLRGTAAVVERFNGLRWSRRIEGYYRHRGLERAT